MQVLPLRWLLSSFELLLATACLLTGAVQAQELVAIPALTRHVLDTSGTLSSAQQDTLDAKLAAFETASGSQVVVLMVPSTLPEDIASYANRVGSNWKIGRKDVGDGLLLIIAKNDHKLRIEVARALEGAVPDLAAKRVIDQVITPRFKQGDFAGGIDAGLDQLFALIRHEELPVPAQADASAQAMGLKDMLITGGFMLFMAGAIARNIFGPVGAASVGTGAVTGAVTGGASWLLLGSSSVALVAAVGGLVVGFIGGFILLLAFQPAWALKPRTNYGSHFPPGSSGSGGFGGGGFGGGSGGGGFSSGGGGSFGGGGASGGW